MRIAMVLSRAPDLCGTCIGCKQGPADAFTRVAEYLANLDDGEAATLKGALTWYVHAYPRCDRLMPKQMPEQVPPKSVRSSDPEWTHEIHGDAMLVGDIAVMYSICNGEWRKPSRLWKIASVEQGAAGRVWTLNDDEGIVAGWRDILHYEGADQRFRVIRAKPVF